MRGGRARAASSNIALRGADRRGRFALARRCGRVEEGSVPEFEHEERPEVGRVVAPPAVVLGVEKLDVSLIEVAARARARVEEYVAYVFAQFLIDPLLDGQAEALLGAVENLVGHEA